jgi:hypothetical protein
VQVVACQDPVAVEPSNSYGMMDEGENETKLCSKAAIVMARTAPERESFTSLAVGCIVELLMHQKDCLKSEPAVRVVILATDLGAFGVVKLGILQRCLLCMQRMLMPWPMKM